MTKQTAVEPQLNLVERLRGSAADDSRIAWQQLSVARQRLSLADVAVGAGCKAEVQSMFIVH